MLSRTRLLLRPLRIQTRTPIARPFSSGCPLYAQKDAQNKDSLVPRSTEYSKSGSDDQAAATEEAAFDPSKTRPEEESAMADKESGDENNPLEASPANHDISKPKSEEQDHVARSKSDEGQSSGRERTSGRGSAPKSGGGKYGGGSVGRM